MATDVKDIAARKRLAAARSDMILDEPFFGALALRLILVEDYSALEPMSNTPSMWTDGKHLGYHPDFVHASSADELIGTVKHEVLHCSNGHPWRRDARDQLAWNIACDHAINHIIVKSGSMLPKGSLIDAQYEGKSAEWIYDRLPERTPQDKSGQDGEGEGSGQQQSSGRSGNTPRQASQSHGPTGQHGPKSSKPQGKPGSQAGSQLGGPAGQRSPQGGQSNSGQGNQPATPDPRTKGNGSQRPTPQHGEVRDCPTAASDGEAPPTEEDWRQATIQAAVLAKGQGKLPAGMERFVEQLTKPRVDWKSALRRFVQEAAKSDYSFVKPNPRYVSYGMYLPALHSHDVGIIAIGVDTSGSIDNVLLGQFQAEIRAIVDEVHPKQVKVLYCDAKVHREETFERDELVNLKPCGGGGTDFRPVFDAIAEWDEPPVCIGYLTDLYGTFPAEDPGIPTLWISGDADANVRVPFGEFVAATM